MSVSLSVTTPETGRPGALAAPTTTPLPAGTSTNQVLLWDNETKQPFWADIRTIVPDAPAPPDPTPVIVPPIAAIGDYTIIEPPLGSTTVAGFAVSLDRPGTSVIELDWKTVDSTAKGGLDYQTATGTLSFAPGEMLKTISVLVLGDTLTEGAEEFGVLIIAARGASVSRTLGIGKIIPPADTTPVEPPPPPPPAGSNITTRTGVRVVGRNGNPIVTR